MAQHHFMVTALVNGERIPARLVCGWDRPVRQFFGWLENREPASPDEDEVFLWESDPIHGCSPWEIRTAIAEFDVKVDCLEEILLADRANYQSIVVRHAEVANG